MEIAGRPGREADVWVAGHVRLPVLAVAMQHTIVYDRRLLGVDLQKASRSLVPEPIVTAGSLKQADLQAADRGVSVHMYVVVCFMPSMRSRTTV